MSTLSNFFSVITSRCARHRALDTFIVHVECSTTTGSCALQPGVMTRPKLDDNVLKMKYISGKMFHDTSKPLQGPNAGLWIREDFL